MTQHPVSQQTHDRIWARLNVYMTIEDLLSAIGPLPPHGEVKVPASLLRQLRHVHAEFCRVHELGQ